MLISLAKIELRHLKRPEQALLHYQAYARRAPGGLLAEEALFGIAKAYHRLGVEKKEKETLRRFVSKYQQSSLKRKADDRLQQLGGYLSTAFRLDNRRPTSAVD